MEVVLVSVGTDGDILPYAGLGRVLRDRGHRVTLVASAGYQALAQRLDFGFRALVSAEENDALFRHPDFWHPVRTAPLAARWGVRFIRRQYDLLSTVCVPGTVLVANPGVFAASMVHEARGVPWVSLVLQPGTIPSSIAPPRMPNFNWLARAPRPVWQVFWRALDLLGYVLVGRELNRVCASLGLKPRRRLFQNWLSPQLAVGMFPDWYGPPQADWPSQLRLTGFPQYDGGERDELPTEVVEFCAAGAPPVAFTFGTGMAHSAERFQAALGACARAGVRGIFLTKFHDQLPARLPATVRACSFAPFQKLFPQCAAVMHHGGVGTVARAMRAGLPQLIQPICFDQADNGFRTRQLGGGECLPAGSASEDQIARGLASVLTAATRDRCRQLTARFGESDALAATADLVENLAVRSEAFR